MITKKAVILNDMGIHVRPSGIIIKETSTYNGKISLKKGDIELDLIGIMDLLALGLVKEDEVIITVSGPDEEVYLSKLVDLFQFRFDFPPE